MTIREVKDILNARLHTPGADLDVQVHAACGSDMMSDVLAYVKDQAVLLTGLNNPQVVRTAEMMDMVCIVFVRGKQPQEQIVGFSSKESLPKKFDWHVILLNQIGFDSALPKRFTAPISQNGADFYVRALDDEKPLFKGKVVNGMGDFSAFVPPAGSDDNREYVIVINGDADLKSGVSDPFKVMSDFYKKMFRTRSPEFIFILQMVFRITLHYISGQGNPFTKRPYRIHIFSLKIRPECMWIIQEPTGRGFNFIATSSTTTFMDEIHCGYYLFVCHGYKFMLDYCISTPANYCR